MITDPYGLCSRSLRFCVGILGSVDVNNVPRASGDFSQFELTLGREQVQRQEEEGQ